MTTSIFLCIILKNHLLYNDCDLQFVKYLSSSYLKFPPQLFEAHVEHDGVVRDEDILPWLAAVLCRKIRAFLQYNRAAAVFS